MGDDNRGRKQVAVGVSSCSSNTLVTAAASRMCGPVV